MPSRNRLASKPSVPALRPRTDPIALRADLVGLHRTTSTQNARTASAIRQHASALDQLGRGQRELAKQVASLQRQGDAELLERLLRKLNGVERRVATVARAQSNASSRSRALQLAVTRQDRALSLQTRSAKIASLRATASSMQSSAYGTRGSPLATNNLLLAANSLLWNFGGDLLRVLGVPPPRALGALAWLAPLGSLVTGGVVLGGRQHERFVSGVATGFTPLSSPIEDRRPIMARGTWTNTWTTTVSLRPYIAKDTWSALVRRTDVPVTVSLVSQDLSPDARVVATIREGTLYIVATRVTSGPDTRAAWIVDTGA